MAVLALPELLALQGLQDAFERQSWEWSGHAAAANGSTLAHNDISRALGWSSGDCRWRLPLLLAHKVALQRLRGVPQALPRPRGHQRANARTQHCSRRAEGGAAPLPQTAGRHHRGGITRALRIVRDVVQSLTIDYETPKSFIILAPTEQFRRLDADNATVKAKLNEQARRLLVQAVDNAKQLAMRIVVLVGMHFGDESLTLGSLCLGLI
eukprot:gene10235-7281_t